MDSCCFIDMAKHAIGRHPADRDREIWFLKKLLEAAKDGHIAILTSTITVAECQHADGVADAEVQRLFRGMLTSGQYVVLVQDTVLVVERARNLRWIHNIALDGADAAHVASALEMGCVEFVTTDGRILRRADELAAIGLRVVSAVNTGYLPAEYRQENLLPPGGLD